MPDDVSVWSRFSADPRDPATAALRASDADRNALLTILQAAFADGRLDHAEYDERSDRALAVRTLGEVVPVVEGLVAVAPLPAVPQQDLRQRAEEKYRRDVAGARAGAIGLSVLTTGIWGATSLASGQALFFWPMFPIVVCSVGWIVTTLTRRSRVDEEVRRLERKEQRRERRRLREDDA